MGNILIYLELAALSMFKIILGPVAGAAHGLNLLETTLSTGAGMMCAVFIFSTYGLQIRKWYFGKFKPERKVFTPRNRQVVRVWRKYGIGGVAFLTPVIFTPIGGTLIAVSFGEKRVRIITYMFLSAGFWSPVLSVMVLYFKDVIAGFI